MDAARPALAFGAATRDEVGTLGLDLAGDLVLGGRPAEEGNEEHECACVSHGVSVFVCFTTCDTRVGVRPPVRTVRRTGSSYRLCGRRTSSNLRAVSREGRGASFAAG